MYSELPADFLYRVEGVVMSKLHSKYPDAAKFDHSVRVDLTAVLRASLPGKVLGKGQTLGGLDPRKMELIRAELADGFAFHCFRTARIMASCRIS